MPGGVGVEVTLNRWDGVVVGEARVGYQKKEALLVLRTPICRTH